MAIPDLPVFSFRVNWKEPLDETVSFLTDVLRSLEGCEQRRKLRLTPRRSFDADFLLTGRERTFWDLFMNDLGDSDVLCPLYWDMATLSVGLTAGSSDRIDFDTTRRDWAYQEGGAAIIINKSALDYEVVEIASVDANGVDLVDPVTNPWPRGAQIIPLRRAKVDSTGEFNTPTAAVATISARLILKEENPWVPLADDSTIYGGLPVFSEEPNWSNGLAMDLSREIVTLDNDVGLTYESFPLNRIAVGQQHRWFLPGKDRLAEFRDLVYRHSGRAGSFWLPTFKADFKLKVAAGSSANEITVENVGYGLTGGPKSGREYISIRHATGTIYRRIVSVSPGPTSATEILELDLPVGLALSPGQVRKISFMDTARFDTDEFTITHYGGIDAHHESTASFRTFRNTRVPPAILIGATPVGVVSSALCGEQTEDACPLFFPEFDGWDYEFSLKAVYAPTRSGVSNFYIHRPVEFGGKTGGGNAYGGRIGSDWDELFASSPGIKWAARRVRVDHHLAPPDIWDQSYTGTWHATVGVGIVNFFGEKPVNYVSYYFYWRHWTMPFPGVLAATVINKTSNGDVTKPIYVDVDWRDFRTPPP